MHKYDGNNDKAIFIVIQSNFPAFTLNIKIKSYVYKQKWRIDLIIYHKIKLSKFINLLQEKFKKRKA